VSLLFIGTAWAQNADCGCGPQPSPNHKNELQKYSDCMTKCNSATEFQKAKTAFLLSEAQKMPNDSVSVQRLHAYHGHWEQIKRCFGTYKNAYNTNHYFKNGRSDLNEEQKQEIQRFLNDSIIAKISCYNGAEQSQYAPHIILSVEGFADATGNAAKNMKLSAIRAQKAAEYIKTLVPERLLPAFTIEFEGKGQRNTQESNIEHWRVVLVNIFVGLSYKP
jgi:outer membrane protein OmpA-like peptidoglycan-associated protein